MHFFKKQAWSKLGWALMHAEVKESLDRHYLKFVDVLVPFPAIFIYRTTLFVQSTWMTAAHEVE